MNSNHGRKISKRVPVLLTALFLLGALSSAFAGVTIASPAAGTTVGTSVHFAGSATPGSSYPITAMRIYLDYTSVYTVAANTVDAYLTVAPGTHLFTLQAWDASGVVYKQEETFMVGSGSTVAGVTISSPANGASVSSPVQFTASAGSPTAYPITAMRIYVDNNAAYTVSAASLNTSLSLAGGAHSVTVVAWDGSGQAYTKSIGINVGSASGGGVTISSPANGATVGSPVQFTAAASSSTGYPITAMRIYVDANALYTVNAASLSTSLSLAAGGHSVVVVAWDASGKAYTQSESISVGGTSAPTSGANNYYVSPNGNDGGNGSYSSPWRTITHASQMVGAGAVVHVLPGTYNESVSTTANGTASAHVKFISDQKWGAQINGGGASFAWYVKGDYQDVEGFDVTNANYVGIGYAANHVRILNNRIHDMVNVSCGSNGGAAIDADSYSVTDAQVIGNLVYNIGPGYGSTRCDTIQGIYFATAGNYAANNVVANISGDGITSWHYASNLTVVNNTVVNCKDAGIVIGADAVTNSNSYVANNIAAWNPNAGIVENGNTSGNQFVNNATYANGYNWGLKNGSQSGTVTSNPMFVNYTGDAGGDYRLQLSSPAINAASSSGAPSLDFTGGARPVGAGYDIGAYEYGNSAGAFPWY